MNAIYDPLSCLQGNDLSCFPPNKSFRIPEVTFKKILLVIFALFLIPFAGNSQTNPNEAEWNGSGYSIKKVVSNTSIASGVNFSYTIIFSAPAGATTVSIQDAIPASLVVVNVPTPALVNGVTPTVSITGSPGSQVVNYTLTGLPAGSPSSGSFTIVVKFPEGTTCNGATARNRVGILVNDKWEYTPFVSTSATAADPWVVSKAIISGPVVNPNGGSCGYLMPVGDTVTYRLSVMKKSPYYGNVVGQQNMTSATVTDVLPAGAILLSSTCGIPANSTGTITWQPNSGLLDAANPWAYYYCDITVYYPAASFPNGSFVYNQVSLTGSMCNTQPTHQSNQTCIEIGQVVANPNAFFQKYISLTNRVPGCSGMYTIAFCNNGNVPLSAFNINDAIPSGITVTQVAVWGGSATTTMNITANSGANTIASGINTSYVTSGAIGYGVSNLQLSMTGSLPVGNCIYLYVYFTVNPNPTGTVVTNCATFNGLSNALTLPQTCVSFTVDAGAPHACILKDICSPKSSYDPGDIVRFRVRVQNIGSANLTGAILQDVLHSNFTYIGNESYYVANNYNPPCTTGSGIPVGASAWSGVTTGHSGNNLSWNLPSVPSNCQLFYVGYCGYYGTWGLPYYYIEFDVQIKNTALPGVTPNNYTISGGNLSGTTTSNTVNVLVVASFGQEVKKEISVNNGSSFASTGVVSPGGTARYRLNYKNTSNVPVSSVSLVDLLPRNDGTNDWLVLNRSITRGSQFDATYNANHGTSLLPAAAAPARTLNFAPGLNICLPAFGVNAGCNPTTWGTSPTQNVRINYGSFVLNPAVTVREDFDVTIPASATTQQTACNDFAAVSTAGFLLNGVPQNVALTPIAAPPVCLTVGNKASCCDSVRIEQAPGANGVIGCCARITTKCDVDSVKVSLGSGTISGVNWNCGALPSGFIGQSNFTFPANGCALDMTTCIDPAQTGITVANFTIYFSNGDTCRKVIDLDCTDTPASCCDSIRVEQVYDPTTASCCARIISKCEIKSINVSVANGTLSSTTWNCGPVPAGYVGQTSYTFAPGTCSLDMTNCVNPTQSGTVTVTYTINFADGTTCDKTIDLKCEADVHCCDSVEVKKVVNSDGTTACCTEIITKCEVDSIAVSVLNGTIASASWNCGPIPAGYVGQSNYTFTTANCMADLVTCFNAKQTGVVTVNYVIYFSNGEKCEKSIKIECKAATCCEKVRIDKIVNADGTNTCCLKLVTECEVKAVDISVNNGVISSAAWNCGTLPTGYVGQSNFTFAANGCVLNMKNCFEPTQSGIVTVTYTIHFQNGETCKKTVELECKKEPASDCCALVDFKLKQKWPFFNTQVGTFSITNLDPSSPICSVTISSAPAGSFTAGNLIIDGTPSSQTWNPTSIPASGTLSPVAVNTLTFSMTGVNYKGIITVCVVKCDGTKCCFEFKWNPKIIIGVDVETGQLPISGKLFAVTVNPKVKSATDEKVKYVSFGLSDEQQIKEFKPEFFAISATEFQGDEYPAGVTAPVTAFMGKYNAFFELSQPVKAGTSFGAFNLVFSKMLPKLGCTLFNEEGNIIFSGNINVSSSDTIKTAVLNPASASGSMFEFIKLYPNPSDGSFNVTYATGNQREVEIRIINPLGQVINVVQQKDDSPGIHNVELNNLGLSHGLYKVLLISDGQVLSKSAVIGK